MLAQTDVFARWVAGIGLVVAVLSFLYQWWIDRIRIKLRVEKRTAPGHLPRVSLWVMNRGKEAVGIAGWHVKPSEDDPDLRYESKVRTFLRKHGPEGWRIPARDLDRIALDFNVQHPTRSSFPFTFGIHLATDKWMWAEPFEVPVTKAGAGFTEQDDGPLPDE